MSERFMMALQAQGTTDLVALAKILTAAVQEAQSEHLLAYYDPAVRLIAFQIAFAANGDSTFLPHLDAATMYCQQRVAEGPNAIFIKESERVEVPVPQAS